MDFSLATIVLWAVPVVFAITLHEAAHGYVARIFGDQTAWMLGRVTLNPIKHNRSHWDDPGPGDAVGGGVLHEDAGVHLRLGEAGPGEFRQSSQSQAGHVLGRPAPGRWRTSRWALMWASC
jgi:hypothetical protein